MAKTAILAVRIISDAKQASREFDKTGQSASKMSKGVATAGRVSGRILAVGLTAAAVAAVKFANAAAEDEASAAKMAQTLKKSAGATDAQVAATERWITAQGKALGVADDELRPAIARLTTASGSLAQAQKDASLAMDIAAARGKPLSSVTEALAKAYNGNTGALGRLGVATKDAAGNALSLQQIQKNLNKQYGGAAAAAADTTAGKQKKLAVAYGELTEAIGAKLLPILGALVTAGLAVVEWIDKNQVVAGVLIGTLGTLTATVFVITKAIAAWSAITKAFAAVQAVLNVVLSANPIGLLIIAIAAVIAGLILAYKHSSKFRAIVQAVGKAAAAAFGWVVAKVTELVGWVAQRLPAAFALAKTLIVGYLKLVTFPFRTLLDVIKAVVGFVRDKAPGAFAVFKTLVVGYINTLLTPFRALWNLIQDIIGAIKNIKLPSLPDLNPFGRGIPGISGRTTFAGATSGGGGDTFVFNVNGFAGDRDQLVATLKREFARSDRRAGK